MWAPVWGVVNFVAVAVFNGAAETPVAAQDG